MIDEISQKQKNDFGNINSNLKPDGTLITECDLWSDKKNCKRAISHNS